MKPYPFKELFFYLLLSMMLGHYLTFGSIQIALMFFALEGVAVFFLVSSGIGKDFSVSSEENRFLIPQPQVILEGKEISLNDVKDQQEDRFLKNFEYSKVVRRTLFTYTFLFCSSFFMFFTGRVELSLVTVLPVLSGFFIIKSIYVGHLLVPLALSLWSVIMSFNSETSSPLIFIYIFFSFMTLREMSSVSGNQVKWGKVEHVFLLTTLFFLVIYGLGFFLPLERPPKRELPETQFKGTHFALQKSKSNLEALQRELTTTSGPEVQGIKGEIDTQLEKVSRIQEKLQQAPSERERGQLKHELKTLFTETRELNERFQEMMEQEKAKSASSGGVSDPGELQESLGIGDIEGLKSAMAETQDLLSDARSRPSSEKGEIQNLEERAMELKAKFEEASRIDPVEREKIQRFIEENRPLVSGEESSQSVQQADLEKSLGALKELVEKDQHTGPELKEMNSLIQDIHEKAQAIPRQEFPRQAETEAVNVEEALKPLEDKKEFNLKKYLPLLVLFLLFVIVQYFLRKKGIKKVKTDRKEELMEVREQWRRIQKLDLSPREEVIHFYNILHDALNKIHFEGSETPPSCIVYDFLKDLNPSLDKATFAVTEIYTKTFYGERDVSHEALKEFRKSIGTILKTYEVI